MITARQLAAVLAAELALDGWGDVDPWWIHRVAETNVEDPDDDHAEQVEALREVFERAADRINRNDLPETPEAQMPKKLHIKEQRFISIITVYANSAEGCVDMMRYDSCYPTTEEDAHKLGRLMSHDGSPDDHIVQFTRCSRNELPATEGRWRSFNCVVLDERHPEAQALSIEALRTLVGERLNAERRRG